MRRKSGRENWWGRRPTYPVLLFPQAFDASRPTQRIWDKVTTSLLVLVPTCNPSQSQSPAGGGAYAGQPSPDCDSVHHVDDDAEGETDGWWPLVTDQVCNFGNYVVSSCATVLTISGVRGELFWPIFSLYIMAKWPQIWQLVEKFSHLPDRNHTWYLSPPPPPAVVYFFQAGVLFSTKNANGTAFSKVYSTNINTDLQIFSDEHIRCTIPIPKTQTSI